MIGVAIRKLKRAAASRSSPANRPAEIEMPERLTPGISASAWATPMPRALGNASRLRSCRREPQRSASHRIAAADQEHERDEAGLADGLLDQRR